MTKLCPPRGGGLAMEFVKRKLVDEVARRFLYTCLGRTSRYPLHLARAPPARNLPHAHTPGPSNVSALTHTGRCCVLPQPRIGHTACPSDDTTLCPSRRQAARPHPNTSDWHAHTRPLVVVLLILLSRVQTCRGRRCAAPGRAAAWRRPARARRRAWPRWSRGTGRR